MRERSGVQITVLGSRRPGRTRTGRAAATWCRRADYALLLDCGNGVFSKLRRSLRLRRRRRRGDQPPARRPLPRPGPVQLCADLRPAPAAGARWPAGPAPTTRRGRGCTLPAGAREVFRASSGCWGNEDLVEEAFDLHEYDGLEATTLGTAARSRFCEVPHFTTTYAVEVAGSDGSRLTYSADCRPNDELVRLRARHRRADDRGHAAAAGADRQARSPHAARGRRSRRAGRAPAGWCSPTSPTSSIPSGRVPSRRGLRRIRRARARGRRLHGRARARALLISRAGVGRALVPAQAD